MLYLYIQYMFRHVIVTEKLGNINCNKYQFSEIVNAKYNKYEFSEFVMQKLIAENLICFFYSFDNQPFFSIVIMSCKTKNIFETIR